jgi:hypothetical protein
MMKKESTDIEKENVIMDCSIGLKSELLVYTHVV